MQYIRRMKIIISILLLFSFLCQKSKSSETNGVIVSIKPLHSLVQGVIGDTGKAKLLVSGKNSPHNYQMKPSQIKDIQDANIIFYIDDELEIFLSHYLKNLPVQIKKLPVAQKAGIIALKMRKGAAWESHQHGLKDEHGQDECRHYHGDYDMHVWLDPENAKKITILITKELSKIFPQNRDFYKANASELIKKIDLIHEELKSTLDGLQNAPFIVFHDAYQYFERTYGLNGVGSITNNGELPTPNRIKDVRNKLHQSMAKCVFKEPQFPDRFINIVLEGTSAKTAVLDPLGANIPNGVNLYFDLLRNLANDIKGCLCHQIPDIEEQTANGASFK